MYVAFIFVMDSGSAGVAINISTYEPGTQDSEI